MQLLQLKHVQQLEAEKMSKEFELEIQRLKLIGEGKITPEGAPLNVNMSRSFDVVSNLKLLLKFNEGHPDVFFLII